MLFLTLKKLIVFTVKNKISLHSQVQETWTIFLKTSFSTSYLTLSSCSCKLLIEVNQNKNNAALQISAYSEITLNFMIYHKGCTSKKKKIVIWKTAAIEIDLCQNIQQVIWVGGWRFGGGTELKKKVFTHKKELKICLRKEIWTCELHVCRVKSINETVLATWWTVWNRS